MLCGVALQLLETALDKKSAKGGVVTEWHETMHNVYCIIHNVAVLTAKISHKDKKNRLNIVVNVQPVLLIAI